MSDIATEPYKGYLQGGGGLMELLVAYVIVGYFWGLMCENRGKELNYPNESVIKFIVGFLFNAVLWPISMVMGYRLEQRLARIKPNRWR